MNKNILKGILLISVLLCTAVSCKSTAVEGEDSSELRNYVGWVDSTGKDVVYKDGMIQLKVKQNLGTFNIGVINENEKVISVLSTAEEFTTSGFVLRTSKKTVNLRKDGNIRTSTSRKNNGIGILYTDDKTFDAEIIFEIIDSGESDASDLLKITSVITNIGTKKEDFAFKAVFDTVLGESDKYHFYTSENLPVKNEVSYRTMQNQKWFVSKNKSAAVEFILAGADTTAPELVALANYTTLQNNGWEPEMTAYRAFDNVLSYNNSAVEIIYPSAKLKPNQSSKNVMYLAFASDGNDPVGHKYIFKPEPEEEIEKVDLGKDKNSVVTPVKPDPQPVVEEMIETKGESLPVEPVEEETVNGLTKKQLSPEYIQNLIDRITELESDTSKVKSEELNLLNQELDEILSALR